MLKKYVSYIIRILGRTVEVNGKYIRVFARYISQKFAGRRETPMKSETVQSEMFLVGYKVKCFFYVSLLEFMSDASFLEFVNP